jgi:hypothetical protein
LIGLNLPVLAKYKTDKPEHQQDGSGYHQPTPITQSRRRQSERSDRPRP